MTAHADWVQAQARRIAGNHSDASDLSQAALLQFLKKPPNDLSRLRGWFHMVLRNLARSRAIAEARRRRRESQWRAGQRHRVDTPLSGLTLADTRAAIAASIESLRPRQLEVVQLRYFDGFTIERIAQRLDTSPASVRRRLEQAQSRLRSDLGATRRGGIGALGAVVASVSRDEPTHAIWSLASNSLRRAGRILARTKAYASSKVLAVACVIVVCAATIIVPEWNIGRPDAGLGAATDIFKPSPGAGSTHRLSLHAPTGAGAGEAVEHGESGAAGASPSSRTIASVLERSRSRRHAAQEPSPPGLLNLWPDSLSTIGTAEGPIHVSRPSLEPETKLTSAWQEKLLSALPDRDLLVTVWAPERTGFTCATERRPNETDRLFLQQHAIEVRAMLLDRREAMTIRASDPIIATPH